MSEFFSNLLDRHLGTCNVVKPRCRSRFETETTGSAIPLPIDHSGTDETGDENLERQDIVVRSPENHSIKPPINSIETQKIDTEVKLPVDQTDPVDPVGDNLERQNDLIRSTAITSILTDVNALEMEPHLGSLVSRQQDSRSVKLKPVEQPNPKEKNAPRQVFQRQSIVETEGQRTLPGDLVKRISATQPNEEANALTSELGYRSKGKLDSRIRTMPARLQGHQKVRPAEHAETNNLDRSIVTGMGNAADIAKEPAALDEAEKVGSSDSDQKRQYAFASDNRDMSRDDSLEPPKWFSRMQPEFVRRWNELESKSQPEPVINVTIGRIEVKATRLREQEQHRQQKKPSGVMSLDKYLSQSGWGGRG
jgi:hypothetical protein